MTDHTSAALAEFDTAIAAATTPDSAYKALQDLATTLIGANIFTIMTVDMVKEVSRREYTSHPVDYPVSGTKPLHYDRWFDTVHKARETFVANTIEDIATVFSDHKLIAQLGCASVVNIPVVIGGTLLGTVNCLEAENHYTPERVERSRLLHIPSKLAFLAAERARRD